MQLFSKNSNNELLAHYFPFNVEPINHRGLYLTHTQYLLFKCLLCTLWFGIFGWQIIHWRVSILLYLSTWNILLGLVYNAVSLAELFLSSRLKKYKMWRINHFMFTMLVVLSTVVMIFDCSLISRTYTEFTSSELVMSWMYYTTAFAPMIFSLIELAFNSVLITTYRCLVLYLLIGGPYLLMNIAYCYLNKPVYKELTYNNSQTYIILGSTVIISGIVFLAVRIYCEMFKVNRAVTMLAQLQSIELQVEDMVVEMQPTESEVPQNLASYARMKATRKHPSSIRKINQRGVVLNSLKRVFAEGILIE